MTRDEFWRLIAETRPANGNCDDHSLALTERLVLLEADEIVSFEHHCRSVVNELDCPSVGAIARLIFPMSSDDVFTYFCGWAILQGKTVVDDFMSAPDRVEKYFPPNVSPRCEAALATARRAYERKTRRAQIPIKRGSVPPPRGEPPLCEEEIRERYPGLWRRFVDES
jgi:hypothetical protein